MKIFKHLILSLLVCLIAFPLALLAQNPVENTPQKSVGELVVDSIQIASQGNIEIDIAPNILNLIFTEPQPAKTSTAQNKHNTAKKEKVSNKGYRVQVFGEAGNQATLASRCRARGSMVLAKFPKYRGQLYIFSKSPNWYCRVGNFKTSGEAAKAAGEIRRAFPQFAGEVRTVQCTIVPK